VVADFHIGDRVGMGTDVHRPAFASGFGAVIFPRGARKK
jgi:hypothetical protein